MHKNSHQVIVLKNSPDTNKKNLKYYIFIMQPHFRRAHVWTGWEQEKMATILQTC